MDEIEQLLVRQVEVINRIESFFELQACKVEILPDLINLQHSCRTSSENLKTAIQTIDYFRTEQGPRYAEILRKVRRNEQLILHLLEHLDRKTSATNGTALRELNVNVKQEQKPMLPGTVEKMYLADYQKSPFVSKMKPRCLSFLDFNIHISQEDFDQIPKYMRGRETLAELMSFLDTIVSCFEEKYSLLYKNKAAVTNQQDLALWKTFNQQQLAFPNNKFVTEGDIARKMGRLIDKKANIKLQMLRHLRILQETRSEGTVYFLWIRE